MARCKYGKLKNPSGGRRCKRRRSYRTAAGVGLGTLLVMGVGAVGAYKFWESQGA